MRTAHIQTHLGRASLPARLWCAPFGKWHAPRIWSKTQLTLPRETVHSAIDAGLVSV